ncbi:J domain-containing protein [Nonomuraea sp. NBC_01738]|uniref:J domain-containing protein n=1 Tax=Nonomuraea sp. NBC_01738 TaxID=2976003 RepID=UPI003FA3C4E9
MLRPSDIVTCRTRGRRPGCGRPIRWTTTEAGRPFAVDADPHPDGNTAIMRDAAGVLRSRRVSEARPLAGWEQLMMPHAATCSPQASRASREPPRTPPGDHRRSRPEARPLYEVLGVSCTASAAEIRTAYRRLARQLHPDINPDPRAAERFKEITHAYQVLSDPATRSLYDVTGRPPR